MLCLLVYCGITKELRIQFFSYLQTKQTSDWLSSCDICTIGASFEHPVIIQKIDGGINISSAGLSIDVTARKAWDIEAEYGEVIGSEVNTSSIPSHVFEWFRDHVGNARHGEGDGGDEEDDGTHVVGALVLDCFHLLELAVYILHPDLVIRGCVYSCHSDWKGVHQRQNRSEVVDMYLMWASITAVWFLSRLVLRIIGHWSVSISGIHYYHRWCS